MYKTVIRYKDEANRDKHKVSNAGPDEFFIDLPTLTTVFLDEANPPKAMHTRGLFMYRGDTFSLIIKSENLIHFDCRKEEE